MNNTFAYHSLLIFRNQCLLCQVGVIFAKDFQQNRSFLPSSHVNMSSKALHLPTLGGLCYVFWPRGFDSLVFLEIINLGRSGSEQCTTELTLAKKIAFLPTILEQIEYILHEMHMETYVL